MIWPLSANHPNFQIYPVQILLCHFPPYPNWFTCGNIFNELKNDQQKPAKRVVATKHTLDSFKGFLHFDLDAVRITSPTCEGVECLDFLILQLPFIFLPIF